MAADLQVYPVRVTLAPEAPTAVLTLINRGDVDTLLQLSVVAWSQDGGGDKLEPTRDVLANPGVFLLKGGEQQIARFALRVPEDVKERSYRIVVQEVPRQRVTMGFSTVLRMLIPVFVPTPNPTVAMEWDARAIAGGIEIAAHNRGTVHVQVKTLKFSGDGFTPGGKVVNLYVLPGATGFIRLPFTRPVAVGSTLQLQVDSDQVAFSASVRVGAAEGVSGRQ